MMAAPQNVPLQLPIDVLERLNRMRSSERVLANLRSKGLHTSKEEWRDISLCALHSEKTPEIRPILCGLIDQGNDLSPEIWPQKYVQLHGDALPPIYRSS